MKQNYLGVIFLTMQGKCAHRAGPGGHRFGVMPKMERHCVMHAEFGKDKTTNDVKYQNN